MASPSSRQRCQYASSLQLLAILMALILPGIVEAQSGLSTILSTTAPSTAPTSTPTTLQTTSSPPSHSIVPDPTSFNPATVYPTGSGFSASQTGSCGNNVTCEEDTNFPTGGGGNYYYIFIAVFFLIIAIAVWISSTRRRRRSRMNAGRQGALAQDMHNSIYAAQRRWPGERRAVDARLGRVHTRGRSEAVRVRDEGLDERGEAPPPYKRDDDGNLIGEGGLAIPMQTLQQQDRSKPPDYHVEDASPLSPTRPSEGEASGYEDLGMMRERVGQSNVAGDGEAETNSEAETSGETETEPEISSAAPEIHYGENERPARADVE